MFNCDNWVLVEFIIFVIIFSNVLIFVWSDIGWVIDIIIGKICIVVILFIWWGNVIVVVYKKDWILSCNYVNRLFKFDFGVFISVFLIYFGVYFGMIEWLNILIIKIFNKLLKKMFVFK